MHFYQQQSKIPLRNHILTIIICVSLLCHVMFIIGKSQSQDWSEFNEHRVQVRDTEQVIVRHTMYRVLLRIIRMVVTIRWRETISDMFVTVTFPYHLSLSLSLSLFILKIYSAYKLASPNRRRRGAHYPKEGDASYSMPNASRTYRSIMQYL